MKIDYRPQDIREVAAFNRSQTFSSTHNAFFSPGNRYRRARG